jgi:predicted nucleic acid-binding Zn ribbon protein
MGFGPYRYHYRCTKCGVVTAAMEAEEDELEEEEEPTSTE